MRRPRRLVFDDEDPLERVQILRDGLPVERAARRACSVSGQGRVVDLCRYVPGEALQQPKYALGIADDCIDALNVCTSNLVDISANRLQGVVGGQPLGADAGPAPNSQLDRELEDRQRAPTRCHGSAIEQVGEGDRAVAHAALEKAHRAHPHPDDPHRSRVSRLVVSRNR